MSDLISRDKLKDNIAQALSYCLPRTLYMSMTVERILNAIDEEEAVDAAPVVRCKDCKKRYTFECPCQCHNIATSNYWFCPDGERKEVRE